MAGEKPFKLMQARDANDMTVSASQIGQQPEPFVRPLRCPYCEHEVHTQSAYPKTSKNGKPFTVSAHFHLARNKDRTPAEHDPGCPLRTDHTIATIARTSDGFAQVKRGQLQLRLVLPVTTDSAAPTAPKPGAPIEAPPAEPVNRTIRSVGPPLPPVITTAARIAQLLTLYGHAPDALAQFTVKHPALDTPVPWNDFCFGPDPRSIARLYRALGATSNTWPVAVHGQVTSSGVSARGYAWCLIARDVPTSGTGAASRFPVFLRSPHPQLLADLERGMHVLALGAPDSPWELWEPKSEPAAQLRLFVRAHWQLSYWSVGPTGLPSTPASPAPLPAPSPAAPKPASTGRLASTAALRSWTTAREPSRGPATPATSVAPVLNPAPDPAGPKASPTQWWQGVPELEGLDIPPMPTHAPANPDREEGRGPS